MAVTRAGFQQLADKLINSTFGDFKLPLTLKTLGNLDYATQTYPVLAEDVTEGIRVEFTKYQFDNASVQVGDYQIVLEKQGLAVDVRSDNTEMTFNGKSVTIKNVEEDAADAVYTLHVKDK